MRKGTKLYSGMILLALVAAVIAIGPVCSAQERPAPRQIYDEKADAHVEIRDALAKAKGEHKRVIVVFGANWCFDCHVLDDAFHKPELASIIADELRSRSHRHRQRQKESGFDGQV